MTNPWREAVLDRIAITGGDIPMSYTAKQAVDWLIAAEISIQEFFHKEELTDIVAREQNYLKMGHADIILLCAKYKLELDTANAYILQLEDKLNAK